MNKTFPKVFSVITILALMLMAVPMQSAQALGGGSGSISLATLGTAYTQDFNTLANTGTTNNLTINGWFLNEAGTSARNNGQYAFSTGSDTSGDVYSFGATTSTERAFGTLFSGTLTPTIGASFTNNTGFAVTSLDISYIGEMWRLGQNTAGRAADRLDFQLSTNATSIITGTWTDYNSLDFSSPVVAGTVGALNGNASGNQTPVSLSITGLSIPNGASFWIRWNEFDISPGADDGLAVDSFSLTPRIVDFAPEVASTFPVNGATDFPINANLTVTFTEPVNVTPSWFTLMCSVSGNVSTSFSGGPTTFTLDPGIALTNGETCTLTVLASQVSDVDANDPPDNMVLNFVVGFTAFDVCVSSNTPIYTIQGSGLASPLAATVVSAKGVVVGDFETTTGQQGFYLQDLTGDGDSATSDGIFVFTGSSDLVSAGQVVRVTGTVRERFDQTSITGGTTTTPVPAANIVSCGMGSVPATDVFMPFATADEPERFEGMLVRFPQNLVISEYFNFERFGEMVIALPLDGETRPFTGTSIDEPGAPALARADANSLRRITLDDTLGTQNPPTLRHPNGATFDLTNRFRGGDTVTNTVGVLGYDFGLYRIQPTGPADYASVNPRPASPEPVGGTIRVAGMNTLNFFVTADYPTGNPLDNKCGPSNNVECRGWDSDQTDEFTRQRDKLLTALSDLDADIIGLNELENSTGVEPLASIVSGLPGYAYINTGTIGTDAIKVGMIYRPAFVTPVGDFKLLTSAVDSRFIDTKSRPSLVQTFEVVATGARFTVVVNHLKSKGSACDDVGDPDLGDGQGNCSQTRRAAAEALVDWLATDPTGSGDPDFIIVGDLNSYAQEDTIDEIKAGSDDTVGTNDDFTNLIAHFHGAFAYSYTFDGAAGYLDHALANASLLGQVTGAADWHINSDEPDIFDYDTSFKPPAQDALYEVNPYRTSDHDPVVVGLVPNAPPTANAGGPYPVDEGVSVSLMASGSDPNGDSLTYAWDLDNNGSFETSGQSPTFNVGSLDGPNSYTIKVKATDPGGLFAVASTTVEVANVAPTATFGIPSAVNEGGSYGIILSGPMDPSAADTTTGFTYAFDCGSGYGAFGSSGGITCPAVDNPGVTVKGKIKDKDGGVSEYTATVVINNVIPVVNAVVASLEPSLEGQSVSASASFTDLGVNDAPFTCTVNYGDGSGALPGVVVANICTGPAHTYTTFGSYTVTVSVTDKDGGVGSNSSTHVVIYKFLGFFQPVDNLPTINSVNAGRAIPVKFSLSGYKGLNIFAVGYPASQQVVCGTNVPVDAIEETVTAGSSSLSYSSGADQYNYVWKTEKSWAGTCRQLIVKLNDGTIHTAIFMFR